MSVGEWKQLRGRARTAEDFRTLASLCRERAGLYRKKQANCEDELQQHHMQSSPQSVLKHPDRKQTLATLIAQYSEMSEHWRELAGLYSSKATEIEAARSTK